MRFFCYTRFICAMTQNRIGLQLSLWQMQVSRLIAAPVRAYATR
ncbi:hypothetical protein [Streptomyces doebereineriae]